MDQKKLDKLQKLYSLAVKNPNQNEAIVAAHKFINAIAKDNLHITVSAQPQVTQEQIDQALKENYERGYKDGYDKGTNVSIPNPSFTRVYGTSSSTVIYAQDSTSTIRI